MSKVVIFWPYAPKFFRPLQIFPSNKPFFRLYRPKNHFLAPKKTSFLDLKNFFLDLKNFITLFKPKNSFLDFLDLKISLNPLKTLRKHLFSLQIDEKNNFFSIYSKKLPYLLHIQHQTDN